MKKIFITGTDTSVGKTYFTTQLLNTLNKLKLKTIGVKPISSGANLVNDEYKNEDGLSLQASSSLDLPYKTINPFVFAIPASPNIAAAKENKNITINDLITYYQQVVNLDADYLIIEGVGGWLVPLNNNETMADFVAKIKLPIIMVVAIKLGCINHSLLTEKVITAQGLNIKGWVANCNFDCSHEQEIIATLKSSLNCPLVSILQQNGSVQDTILDHL